MAPLYRDDSIARIHIGSSQLEQLAYLARE